MEPTVTRTCLPPRGKRSFRQLSLRGCRVVNLPLQTMPRGMYFLYRSKLVSVNGGRTDGERLLLDELLEQFDSVRRSGGM